MTHSPHPHPARKKNSLRSAFEKLQGMFGAESAPKKQKMPQPEMKVREPSKARTAILAAMPAGENILNGAPISIELDGNGHVLAFRSESIILDGVNYTIAKNGEALDIREVDTDKHTLRIAADGSVITLNEAECGQMFTTLLKRGTFVVEPVGMTISRF